MYTITFTAAEDMPGGLQVHPGGRLPIVEDIVDRPPILSGQFVITVRDGRGGVPTPAGPAPNGLRLTARFSGTRFFNVRRRDARPQLKRLKVAGRLVFRNDLSNRHRSALLRGRQVDLPKLGQRVHGSVKFTTVFRICLDGACKRVRNATRTTTMRPFGRYFQRVRRAWQVRLRGNLDTTRSNLPPSGPFTCAAKFDGNISLRRWSSKSSRRPFNVMDGRFCSFPWRQLFNSGWPPGHHGRSLSVAVSGRIP